MLLQLDCLTPAHKEQIAKDVEALRAKQMEMLRQLTGDPDMGRVPNVSMFTE